MVDANIIISAILFPKSIVAETLKHMISNHELTLSQYTIDEIQEVFKNKFPHKKNEMKIFMDKLPHKRFTLKEINNTKKYPNIRDYDDIPVLVNAIESNVDLFITGDKDFDEIRLKRPKIMNPRNYTDEHMK